MTVGVAIPVFGGRDAIGGIVDGLLGFAGARGLDMRIALVDDAGGGRSAVLRLAERHDSVTALLMERNVGQQRALYEGLRALAGCDAIITMDDDGAHPVALIDELLARLNAGAELCYAVSVRRAGPWWRKGGALLRDALFALCTNKPRGVRVGAYRAMTGSLAARLTPEPDGFIYLSAAAFRLRPRTDSFLYEPGPACPTSYTPGKLARLYLDLFTHYTEIGRMFGGRARRERGGLWQP